LVEWFEEPDMSTVVNGDFEWDEQKEMLNLRKHGVTFIEAIRVFLDPLAHESPDAVHADRWILVGMSMPERLLYVVYADRAASGRIRIISGPKGDSS
jgi:uncharacterized DUF497 family protein